MAFYGYKGGIEDYSWNSSYSYDVSSASAPLSEFDSSSPYYSEYDSNYSYDPYIQYHYDSFYNYNEPKLLQYEPPPPPHYYTHYFPSETRFTVSYSKVEGDEDDYDFDEYDPTPYGGGYDIVSTYGKPLPPSDETCYPRTAALKPANPPSGHGSVPSPRGKAEDIPSEKILPSETKPGHEGGSLGNADGVDVDVEGSFGSESSEDESGLESGIEGDYDYGIVEPKVSDYVPYCSGLEAVDICESIFGHWPCLKKIERLEKERCRELCECESEKRYDPFQHAADYLFGSSSAYDDHRRSYYQP